MLELELAIGEEIRIDDMYALRCVEDKTAAGCTECVLFDTNLCGVYECLAINRKDGVETHFELVK